MSLAEFSGSLLLILTFNRLRGFKASTVYIANSRIARLHSETTPIPPHPPTKTKQTKLKVLRREDSLVRT